MTRGRNNDDAEPGRAMLSDKEIADILHDAIDVYGYDFTSYARASLLRRINRLYVLDRFRSAEEFRLRLRTDEAYFRRFVEEITVNVTEMFRDPSFFRLLREEVLPGLAAHSHIRIWHAGCSTGEEVYSMAVLLKEAGVLHKSLIYATDINPSVLGKVKEGIFPLSQMRQYSANYIAAGGLRDFSSYYTAQYDSAKFDHELRQRIVCSTHNLVSDHSFNEFHVVICRNVLIYFSRELQERVFGVLDISLAESGYLCLGSKETLKFSSIAGKYEPIGEKVWRKKRWVENR